MSDIDDKSQEIASALREWIRKELPPEFCGQKLREGCEATLIRSYHYQGTVIESDAYVDFPTRLAYLKVVMQLGGYGEAEDGGEGSGIILQHSIPRPNRDVQ